MNQFSDRYNYLLGLLNHHESLVSGSPLVKKRIIVLVEGILDSSVFSKLASSSIVVQSAGNNNDLFRHSHIKSPRGRVNDAIYEIIKDISDRKIIFPHLEVYGVVDKDFQRAFDESDHFFITDTTDCETLLLSSNSFSFEFAPTYSNELMASVYGLSYQMGCYRRAFLKYKEGKVSAIKSGKPLSIRQVISERLIKQNPSLIYRHEVDISLDVLLNLFGQDVFDKDNKNVFESELAKSLAKPFIFAKLREEGAIDSSNAFIHHVKGFSIDEIDSYWDKVRGHDICLCAETVIPRLKDYYVRSSFEDTVVENLIVDNFKKTGIYQKMSLAGLLD